jgi:hypothetical protein
VSGELLRAVAEKCVAGPGVICSSVRAYAGLSVGGWGGRLARRDLIWIQWALVQPTLEWARVTAPLGGLYAMSAETARILSGPTGDLFDTVVGGYGYIEEMLGIKCHFLQVPIWVYAAAQHEHLFKRPGAGGGFGREQNLVYCLALYFSREFFEERFRAAAEKLLPAEEVAALRALADGKCARSWAIEAERAFYDSLPEGLG